MSNEKEQEKKKIDEKRNRWGKVKMSKKKKKAEAKEKKS